MITVHRFPLLFVRDTHQVTATISMPQGAEIKYFGVSPTDNTLSVWAIVDTKNPIEERRFQLFGTGNAVCETQAERSEEFAYVMSTVDREFVWHLFERP